MDIIIKFLLLIYLLVMVLLTIINVTGILTSAFMPVRVTKKIDSNNRHDNRS